MGVIKVRRKAGRRQAGFIAIEFLFALVALVVVATLGMRELGRTMDSQNYQIAAKHQQVVADAATKYLKDNFSAVLALAAPTAPAQITIPMLRNTGYLPTGFSDTNVFGQSVLVLARKPAANQLESIVITTGGETIDEIGTRDIAAYLGGSGGFIPANNTSIVQGARGAWQIPLSNFGMNPGVGHTASALFFENGTLTNDYLYRNAVPGHPEVNTMNTSINVNGNDLNSVRNVNASTVNATTVNGTTVNANVANANTTITAGETTTGGWFRTRGDSGWYNEKWAGGWYMSDPDWVRSYGDKGVYTGGALVGGTVQSNGRTTVGEYLQLNGVATEGEACSPNGLVGRNVEGLTLSCQSGVWKGGSASLGTDTFETGIKPGGGWIPMDCPQGYVMTGMTAPMEDYKYIRCKKLQ